MKYILGILLMSIFAVAMMAQCPDLSAPGDFSAAYRTIDRIPTEDENMDDSRVYYPSVNDTVPIDASPCPIVVFGHGFMTSVDNYYSYAQHYATHGFVCIVPTISNPFLFPNHNYRARLMITAAHYIADLNFETGDIFLGKLDCDNWAFVGHSMGGSISLLAGDRYVNYSDSIYHLDDTLKVIISFGSPQSNPSTVPAHITTPYLIMSGTEDGIAPWEDVREDLWLGSDANGAFAVIDGANHTYFTDSYGHYLTDGTATITRERQLQIALSYSTAYLYRYLTNDTTLCNFLFCYGDSILNSTVFDSVELRAEILNVKDFPSKPISSTLSAHPNPFNSAVRIIIAFSPCQGGDVRRIEGVNIEIYDINGRHIKTLRPSGTSGTGPSGLEKGGMEVSFLKGDLGGSFVWQPAPSLASGIYLVRARFDNRSLSGVEATITKRIVYLK